MSKQQRRDKKKHKRKAIAKKRVLRRRDVLRKTNKEMLEIEKAHNHFKEKLLPIRNESVDNTEARRQERIKRQLERNLEMLAALEEERVKEESLRNEINADLESQGAISLREKLDKAEEIVRKNLEKIKEKTDSDTINIIK